MLKSFKLRHILKPPNSVSLSSRILFGLGKNDRSQLVQRRGFNAKRNIAKTHETKSNQTSQPQRDGSSAIGLVTITCLGGLWLNNWTLYYTSSPINRALNWSSYVKRRIESTYAYLGTSAAISLAVTSLLLVSENATKLIARFPKSIALTSYTIVNLSYYYIKTARLDDPLRKIAWVTNCASYSPIIVASSKLFGPPVFRAYFYALCILGSLSITAMTAPSASVLRSTSPLSVALGILASSALGSRYLLPPSTYLLLTPSGITLTAGLILFTTSVLRDETPENAELYPVLTRVPYDSMGEGVDLYNKRLRVGELLKMFRDIGW